VAQVVHEGEVIVVPAVLTGAAVAVVASPLNVSHQDIDTAQALGAMVTFLFGVLLAFSIARARERLSAVQDLVTCGNSSLLTMDRLLVVFGSDAHGRIRHLIDDQLTGQIDYKLIDNHLSSGAHFTLNETVVQLVPETRQEEVVYKKLIDLCDEMDTNRSLIESTTGQSLSGIEWAGNLLLLFLLLVILTILPKGSPLGSAAAGFMAATLVTLIVLLRKLDRMRWHERVAIWEPTARLFRSMGLDPYVPREVIDSGRFRPSGRVRVVDYPDPYPDRSNKHITVMDLDGRGPPTPR
jgi:hypothetical protein